MKTNLPKRSIAASFAVVALIVNISRAANQTASVTPIQVSSQLPYRIQVRPYSMGMVDVPTLHSYAVGEYDGKWVFLAGRTNGLHGFNASLPDGNFPSASQNREVWVVDIANRQTWHRPLNDAASGLSAAQIASLSPANTQFYQSGETLYVTGGYGLDANDNFVTFDTLSAIDVPALGDWVVNGTGTAAAAIRQISDPLVRVTGGGMYAIDGRTHLVFGQDFQGPYSPISNGVYTQQVRNFDIVDDGTSLSLANATSSSPEAAYRRRDLNVFPVLQPSENGPQPGLVALSGVFTPTNGAWTVPVEIDANGNPTMDDPTAASTFKQGFNGYHSAKLGLYSSASGEMHEVLFGGISLQYREEDTGLVKFDVNFPFVNDITAVRIDAEGIFSQHHLGYFPEISDLAGNRIRFGANAEFLPVEDLAMFSNGVIDLDAITGETTLGHIFGGLAANAPHTRSSVTTLSSASNQIFEVVLIPVPEPGTALVALSGLICGLFRGRRFPANAQQ